MARQKIHIRGADHDKNPMEGLQKLLNGFCHPKKNHTSDDDTVTDGTQTSEPDLTSQVHERKMELEQHEGESATKATTASSSESKDEGVEVTLPDATHTRENQDEIEATHLNRKLRVTWGLGVAMMALIAVFATLFTLHRLGYDVADFTFTGMDDTATINKPSKPLIKIQYNEKKPKTETPQNTRVESPVESIHESPSSDSAPLDGPPKADEAMQKLDELRSIVAEIKSSEL